ncbi:MAG: HAMP domain-containing sensor histidine kinase [Jatrophihabitantaceae bacterium]
MRLNHAGFGRTSLRTRLTVLLAGLLLIACAAVGIATVIALRSSLMDRLDQQLDAAGSRYAAALEHAADPDNDHDVDNAETSTIGQSAGTLGARIYQHTITAVGVVSDRDHPRQITAADRAMISSLRASPAKQDVDFPGLGGYRLLVSAGSDGDVLVTGLPTEPINETVRHVLAAEAIAFAVVVVTMGFIGAFAVRRSLRPLDRVASTALRVSELPLSSGRPELTERVPQGDDRTEVGRVAIAVNHMLTRIEQALTERQRSEDRLRQFLADASHELRTPLAVVRSHSELIEQQARDLPGAVNHSLDRIESAAARMSRLVDDLFLLARLDSGQSLRQDQIDLSRVALEAMADARVTAPDHRWSLDLPDHPVTVLGDEYRLQQVIVNLLANARVHTPAGTKVRLSIAEHGDQVELSVRDDGPGFPPGITARAHERFVRGDASRTTTEGGSGLGLAIADSVISAHRGSLRIESAPGQTWIRILLPAD